MTAKLENAAGELIDEAEIEGDNSMQQEIIIQNIGSYEMKEATEGEVIFTIIYLNLKMSMH